METVSKYILLKDPEPNAFDTNIVSLNLSFLKKWMENLSKEDPIPCESCFSVHTPFDNSCGNDQDLRNHLKEFIFPSSIKPKLISPINLDEPSTKTKKIGNISRQKLEEQKGTRKGKSKKDDNSSEDEGDSTPKEIPFKIKENFSHKDAFSRNNSYWLCSFCGHPNEIKKKSLEQRKHKGVLDTYYMLKQSHEMEAEEDISVIFCLDNSGSMCSTLEVAAGTFSSKILNEQEIEMLRRALPGESLQFDQGNAANLGGFQLSRPQTHVSRKNCIIKAIQKELNKMRLEFPHRKVGVVIFNDDVVITGDGFSHTKLINGGNLLDYKKCLAIGKESKHMMSRKISESFLTVVKPYEESPEKGKTALCPALVTAVGLASTGKPGSMVILCTDGLANVGFGDLAIGDNDEKKPYEDIAKFALNSGISINVLTIMGEQSRMDVLGAIANKTNGNVDRVNPSVINNEFNQMLNDNLLGRNALLTAFLPNFLKFTDETADCLSSGGSVCRKEIGNISETTKISLRYRLKDYVFDKKRKTIQEGDRVILQIQMKFLSIEGCQVIRVATCEIPVTLNEETAYLNANIGLLANHAAFDAAESQGDERLQRQTCWNNLLEDIRKIKTKKNVLNNTESESLTVYKADARHLEEVTINVNKKRNKPKIVGRPMNSSNNNNGEDEMEEERTFAFKMKKRNYNK